MTNFEIAHAKLTAAQDAFDAIAAENTAARNALKRSKSKANIARYCAAATAFDAALEEIQKLHDAVEDAEVLDAALAAQAEKSEMDAMQPTFAF